MTKRRKMTAKQLKYFGPRKSRAAPRKLAPCAPRKKRKRSPGSQTFCARARDYCPTKKRGRRSGVGGGGGLRGGGSAPSEHMVLIGLGAMAIAAWARSKMSPEQTIRAELLQRQRLAADAQRQALAAELDAKETKRLTAGPGQANLPGVPLNPTKK
jgi:hypothetical protein